MISAYNRRCDILLKDDKLVLYPFCRLKNGLRVSYKPFEMLHCKDLDFMSFNKVLKSILNDSEFVIEETSNLKEIIESEVHKIGYKSRFELDKNAKVCLISNNGDEFKITPTKNVKNGKGYDHIYESQVIVLSKLEDDKVLISVMEILQLCV